MVENEFSLILYFVVLDLSGNSIVKENMQSSLMASEQKMKSDRKWQLFSRRQRRQLLTCFLGFILLFTLTNFLRLIPNNNDIPSPSSSSSTCHCSKSSLIVYEHGECFFNDLICYPGYGGERCEKSLTDEVTKAMKVTSKKEIRRRSLNSSPIDLIVLEIFIELYGQMRQLSK